MIERPLPYRPGVILDLVRDFDRIICDSCAGEGWQYEVAPRPDIHATAFAVGPGTIPCPICGATSSIARSTRAKTKCPRCDLPCISKPDCLVRFFQPTFR